MNNFNETYTSWDFDPRVMIRAALVYIKQLDMHIKNVNHLSEDTIKFYCERLLEIVLTLEEYSNQLYEELSDEEKQLLESKEEERNESLLPQTGKSDLGTEYIRTLLKNTQKRYDAIRATAIDKTSPKT